MRKNGLIFALFVALAGTFFAGCEKTASEKAADNIENAGEKAGDAVENAGDKVN